MKLFVRIEHIEVVELSVPTADPFVIATTEVNATRNVLVRATVDGVVGLGEGSCLPPVTVEDQPDALAAIQRAAPGLVGLEGLSALRQMLDATLGSTPVARAAVETAVLDAWARKDKQPLWRLLGGPFEAEPVETDITIPILPPERMAELARQWWAKGFRKLKVKAGKNLDQDLVALEAIHRAVPGAGFQPDANGGLTVDGALAWLEGAKKLGARVLCFEQPCASVDELYELSQQTGIPVIADESVKTLQDFARVALKGAAGGVNLKLSKSGGLLEAQAIGRAAKERGMLVMVGGMVETRLGMTAAAHLAAALGGADFADLDTAFLLTEERFDGGYRAEGATLHLDPVPGLGVAERLPH
jgi:L-Ala-D/L-Glu epimerase